ncbi:unnamed protein product [Gongylonema pulchrum]|uniref:NR LBD domain-containing protein n=1 Tax=Gongylonema pulchrum TaxID=637853 RepID=A0A183CYA8_9BILA|nr:unnamed protein product [Gongylonema pulchrum]
MFSFGLWMHQLDASVDANECLARTITQRSLGKEYVPSHFLMEDHDYALFSTFEDDFEPIPTENLEKEALLSTMLRFFFKSFKHQSMDYAVPQIMEDDKLRSLALLSIRFSFAGCMIWITRFSLIQIILHQIPNISRVSSQERLITSEEILLFLLEDGLELNRADLEDIFS